MTSIATSPDSKLHVLVSSNGAAQLWDLASGRYKKDLHGDGNLAVFSPDSNHIASVLGSENILLWRAGTGQLNELLGRFTAVNSVAFSPDSALLASASKFEAVRLWRVDTGECIQELGDHGDSVTSVAFSANSKLVTTFSGENIRSGRFRMARTCLSDIRVL